MQVLMPWVSQDLATAQFEPMQKEYLFFYLLLIALSSPKVLFSKLPNSFPQNELCCAAGGLCACTYIKLRCWLSAASPGRAAVKLWGNLSVCLQLREFLGTTVSWHLVPSSAGEVTAVQHQQRGEGRGNRGAWPAGERTLDKPNTGQ